MTNELGNKDEPRPPRITVRALRTLDAAGEEAVAPTVYCPVREHSVAVVACEGCERFHALHFDPTTRATSIDCAGPVRAPAPEDRDTVPDGGHGQPNPRTPLAAIMTTDVVCVRADVSAETVAKLMVERGFGAVPVVDEEGKPMGIVSRADLLRAEHDSGGTEEQIAVSARSEEGDDPGLAGLGQGFHVVEPARVTARDLMSPLVLTLHESSNVGQAGSLMAYEGIHRLPVVADDGRVVGILSSLDLLRWFGRQSGYLIPEGFVRRHP